MVYSVKNEYGLKDLSVNELVDLSNRFEVWDLLMLVFEIVIIKVILIL